MDSFPMKGFEDYANIRPLGSEGGLGDLFRAHKKGLDVEVVIKRVKNEYREKLDQENEAGILKGLKHQYLPRIYDVIAGEDGYIYTIMDLIPGMDMQEYVKQHGPVNQRLAHRWARQLCEVTAYLHAQTPPIIHCDIKPHNIMVTPQDDICLIDFNTSLKDGAFIGAKSHGYAAPEQYADVQFTNQPYAADAATELIDYAAPAAQAARNTSKRSFSTSVTVSANEYGPITKRTDVYAIGATLYYLVSARKPEKSLDVVTPLAAWNPAISPAFLSIIGRAMEKQPANRFADAQEMLRALNDVDQMDQRLKHLKTAKKLTILVLVLLWLASAGSAFFGWYSMHNEREGRYLSFVSQGEAFDQAGDYQQGREAFQQAIDMSPARGEAYLGLSTLQYHQGQYREAIDTIEDAFHANILDLNTLDPAVLGGLYYVEASSCYEMENYTAAIEAYQAAIDSEAGNASYYRGLAMAQARAGYLDAAQATLAVMENSGAADTDLAMVHAEILALLGDKEQALGYYEQVYDNTDEEQLKNHAYLAAAQLAEQTGDYYRSAAILEQAVADLPPAASAIHQELLATVYSEIAQADAATGQEYNEKALDILKALSDSHLATVVTSLNMAAIEQTLGQYTEAEKVLKEALAEYPYDYRVDMRLAYLYADWQGTLAAASRNYAAVWSYYQSAEEKYQQAVANGQEDQNMVLLKNLVEQLRNAGWLS